MLLYNLFQAFEHPGSSENEYLMKGNGKFICTDFYLYFWKLIMNTDTVNDLCVQRKEIVGINKQIAKVYYIDGSFSELVIL